MWEFSFLRILALIAGIVLVAASLRLLRSRRPGRTGVLLLMLIGVAAIGLGLFPNMINLPTDLLSLEDVPGGRLITVLILAVVLLLQRVVSLTIGQSKLRRSFSHLLQAEMTGAFVRDYGRDGHQAAVVAILPCYHEAENLRELLPAMPGEVAGLPLVTLVVDDGSDDGSDDVARRHGALVVSHPTNLGGGRALHTGFAIASAMGACFVVTLDADGQHDPAQIERLVQPLAAGEADLVIGSRALGEHEAASQLRTVGVRAFSWLLSRLTGTRITDCASGFRAFDTRVLRALRLQQEQ